MTNQIIARIFAVASFGFMLLGAATPSMAGKVTPGFCFDLGIEFAEQEADNFCGVLTTRALFDVTDCILDPELEEDFIRGCKREVIPSIEAFYDEDLCDDFGRFDSRRGRFVLAKKLCES